MMTFMQTGFSTGGQAASPRRLLTKRHPIVLVRNFLAIQFATASIYVGAGSVAHFARLWRGIPVVSYYLPFTVAQAAFIFIAEVALVMYIFLNWYRASIAVYDGRVLLREGVFRSRHRELEVTSAAEIIVKQNPLGRLTHYGTVRVKNVNSRWKLSHVSEPHQFTRAIRGASGTAHVPEDFVSLLTRNEHGGLEFKSSLRWDTKQKKVNRVLEKAALKTVAAFMNTRGGHLVLGVRDDRTVRGLKDDMGTLQRKDRDGFEIHVSNLFNSMIGAHLRGCLLVSWARHGGEELCVLSVAPSAEPAYLRADNREEFFVRTGNGTTALTVSQVPAYLKTRFGS